MSGEVFTDASMLEIFRAEVETHVEALTAGLLALERNPGETSQIDEMMRGAHSIKGAARIVGIDPAVRVAHVMEDGFVAAQNGKLTLRPDHVDVLLRGVDMLNRIANASKNPSIDWTEFDSEATPLVAEITAVLADKAIPAASTAKTSVETSSSPISAAATPSESMTPAASAKANDSVTITIPPFLDATAAEKARTEFVTALDSQVARIRLDLSATTDLDAIGLAFLAMIPQQTFSVGQTIHLEGACADLCTVFNVTGIDRLYPSGGA